MPGRVAGGGGGCWRHIVNVVSLNFVRGGGCFFIFSQMPFSLWIFHRNERNPLICFTSFVSLCGRI